LEKGLNGLKNNSRTSQTTSQIITSLKPDWRDSLRNGLKGKIDLRKILLRSTVLNHSSRKDLIESQRGSISLNRRLNLFLRTLLTLLMMDPFQDTQKDSGREIREGLIEIMEEE